MARHPGLNPWLWLGVLIAHAVALQWLAQRLEPMSPIQRMADPMFTRVLQPVAAPEPPAAAQAPAPTRPARPRGAAISPPRPPASAPPPVTETVNPTAPAASETFAVGPVTEPTPAPASAPAAPASAPVATAAPAASAASAAARAADGWPADTRLSYRLNGRFRSGDLFGDAQVQWQRENNNYQVRVEIDIRVWAQLVMTSQGEITATGLAPRAYEELRRGRRRFATLGETTIAFENGKSAPRPDGVQDTASQFVELAHRFATGRETLEVGKTVTLWLARPTAVDAWVYDIVERETLQLPQLGPVEAYRLKPRPIANPRGNITAEMWFAPRLQYLPVRIRVSMGDEAQLDLLVEKIEQR